MALRSSREERKQNLIKNEYLDNPEKGMELISSLISMSKTKETMVQLLSKLDKIIRYDFINICSMENLPNEAEMYEKLKKAFDNVEDLTEFNALANKNIIAIGGGFSAGKSQFLNSILKDNILPTDTTPTTSIPSYITYGQEEIIYALNSFNLKVPINREAVKAISHDFNKKYNVSFSHIIKKLVIETSRFPYKNISFLDTPGYSKADALNRADNTDEKIAKEYLSSADYIIWLVDVSKGTIPDSDIKFIKDLKFQRPIFVVFNKADLKTSEQIKNVLEDAKRRFEEEGIMAEEVIAYNSLASKDNEIGGNKLQNFLEKINSRIKCTTVKQEFDKIFEVFEIYNHNEMIKAKEKLKLLNEIAVNIDLLEQDKHVEFRKLIEECQKKIKKQKRILAEFQSLSDRVNEIIGKIISNLNVVEENKEDRGIFGVAGLRDEKVLSDLKEDMKISGKISKMNAFGLYIECGFGEQVMIFIDDIKEKYSNNVEELFYVGKEVDVQIVEIDRVKKAIKVVVNL
ncbi:GTPase Era, involved in 16S rRNA processing [Caminicella sporogenes DSM 14501]|uniref:GTPase Era, involved in 16S rRNA processing n=1 Tax=Caminicella sporogenes DSM 14501 TaxID=1121266 RepID=A0A1M6RE99_9FIRM|nr:dynamin family protein [Caminicella sporogenes]RKD25211.1 hypothetical protein BET04_03045 [Caminicella sporogenes]SHK30821.1 GTPase Era, involved in 16S rRNA processing [Caminicella sporogenes DSM 14501]